MGEKRKKTAKIGGKIEKQENKVEEYNRKQENYSIQYAATHFKVKQRHQVWTETWANYWLKMDINMLQRKANHQKRYCKEHERKKKLKR